MVTIKKEHHLILNIYIFILLSHQVVWPPMVGLRMVLAACFPSSIMEHHTIAAQGQSAGIAGAQPLLTMT